MTPLIFLVTMVLRASRATGDEGMETRHLYAAIGSSVIFPEVKIDNSMFYDFSRANGKLIVTCHSDCKLLEPYTERGHFYQPNGTFQLNGLTMEDNGTYEYKINFTVKGRIHLRIMAPVTEPVLSIEEVIENGSQCQVTVWCHTKDDGPLNIMFLRNDGIVGANSTANSSSLSMDGWDPATSGRYSCNVANPASSQTSPAIELRLPETWMQKTMRAIAIVFLLQWTFNVAYLLIEYMKELRKRQKGDSNDEVIQSSENPSRVAKVFAIVDNLSGFVKEICVAVTCVYEDFIPVWCSTFPGSFLLFRTSFWILQFLKKPGKCISDVEFICNLAMTFSNMIATPAFCIATLVIISMHYRSPCGMVDIWPNDLSIVCVLLFCPYTWIKMKVENKRKENTEETNIQSTNLMDEVKVPDGDLAQPGNNNDPNFVGHGSDNLSVDQKRSEQGEVFTEGGSEDQAPKSEEGQLQVSEEVNCQSHVRSAPTPDYEDSDGTENTEGQCLLTIEREVGAHDKDRVANG